MASPPGAGFGYDEASVWGFTVANPKGRLTHTSNGVAGTVYSYDAMGRSADQWQFSLVNPGEVPERVVLVRGEKPSGGNIETARGGSGRDT